MKALKEQVRAEMRRQLADLSSTERERGSIEVRAAVTALEEWKRSATVLLFWPRNDEPQVEPLYEIALAAGKTVALPSYDATTETYVPRQFRIPATDLIRGRFGIVEPAPDCPMIPVSKIDFALVPGLAFDATGTRLGRGLGFYDRLLTDFAGFACGVAFRFQNHPGLPCESHDRPMNRVLYG
ncbi:MAG TPA: 5-formyltetrahydrofolate cyclo-ligase [Candidatus Limnocylindria bacterium]|jgi:5-formyltetrahydrofolate cyclo-ligase|nr:5-formyltetrahydrofolate cyclo-ligase [Candidatus Limnocylindria bacterium]